MTAYEYTALDSNGREVRGDLLAGSREDAAAQVRRLGAFPLDLRERRPAAGSAVSRVAGASPGRWPLAPRLPARRLAVFTRQLATLLYAGMPLVRALRLLEQQAAEAGERQVIGAVVAAVEGGNTFSEALLRHPRTFSRLYISMVRAGEASGQLEAVLRRQSELMEKQRRLVRRVRGALTYPAIVCVVAALITAGLMIFIVPKFAAMFAEMLGNCPLPLLTRCVMAVSHALMRRVHVVGLAALCVAGAWHGLRATRLGAYWTDRLALALPGLGAMLRLSACAHFCNTLGTLTRAGVPLLSALQIVRDGTANRVLTRAVDAVRDAVKEGESISGTMRRTGVFPVVLVGMVQVGEETGALPEMLERVAQTYEEEVDAAVESLTAMIEPLLIVFLAGIVGTIVVGMFLPLLKLALQMSGSG